MKKMIFKRRGAPRQANSMSSLYNNTLAITYGTVTTNNTNGTTNVELSSGFKCNKLRILSTKFPTSEPVTGGIEYPPEGAEVIILHPINDINSGFVLPASLNFRDEDVLSTLLSGGDKTVLPGGWTYTYNQETGEANFQNAGFILNINPDTNAFSITDFEGNTFATDGAAWAINGNADFAVAFNDLKAGFDQLKSDFNAFLTHVHGSAGTPPVPPAIPSTASIDSSKVNTVKLP